MKTIVFLRHGQSTWNEENRFTGWTDVDLSEQGVKEAYMAGQTLKDKGFCFDICYTSYLKRAVYTLNYVLEVLDQNWLPVYKTWRLNEKHYGILQGLNKKETAEKYGQQQVDKWRRSYNTAPPPLEEDDARNPRFEDKYHSVPQKDLPRTESLKDTVERLIPYWEDEILPKLKEGKKILVAAHGNSLRAIAKLLKNISDQDIASFNIPTAVPYVFEFDDNLVLKKDYFLGDQEQIKKLQEQVANQAKGAK